MVPFYHEQKWCERGRLGCSVCIHESQIFVDLLPILVRKCFFCRYFDVNPRTTFCIRLSLTNPAETAGFVPDCRWKIFGLLYMKNIWVIVLEIYLYYRGWLIKTRDVSSALG